MIGAKFAGLIILKKLLPFTAVNLNICELIVVPILAPIIIGIEFLSCSIPEFTKLTTITVVVAELCVATVIKNPKNKALYGLSVTFINVCSSFPPDSFFNCVLSNFIP